MRILTWIRKTFRHGKSSESKPLPVIASSPAKKPPTITTTTSMSAPTTYSPPVPYPAASSIAYSPPVVVHSDNTLMNAVIISEIMTSHSHSESPVHTLSSSTEAMMSPSTTDYSSDSGYSSGGSFDSSSIDTGSFSGGGDF
jgi:hypothetical protein